MDIPSAHVFETLSGKAVHSLHHANSVLTACQFIRRRSLLSRGNVERLGLAQTPQYTDDSDRRYSVWFDVFVDSVDIHNRASTANLYGPVLFVFDLSVINRNATGRLWVTKLNPSKWADRSNKERWFQNKSDLQATFVKGRFDQMVVLRHSGGALPFGRHLRKVVLDDPDARIEGADAYSLALGALRSAMQDAGISVPIEKRKCSTTCKCLQYWHTHKSTLRTMFDPKIA